MDVTFEKDWFNFMLNLLEHQGRWLRFQQPFAKSSVGPGTGISAVQLPGSILTTPWFGAVVSDAWEFQSAMISCHLSEVLCPFKALHWMETTPAPIHLC